MSDTHVLPGRQGSGSAEDATAATRHLCAGVYLDREFRDLVIRKVHNAPHRRVAPSYGFDLVPVVRHARRAKRIEVALHTAIVTSVTVPWLLGQVVVALVITCGLGLHWVLWRECANIRKLAQQRTKRGAGETHRTKRARQRTRTFIDDRLAWRELRRRMKFAGAGAAVVVCVTFGGWNRSPDDVLLAGACLAGLALFASTMGGIRQSLLNGIYRAGSLRPANLTRREWAIAVQQSHTCAVYPRSERDHDDDDELMGVSLFGTESPFIGAGEVVHHWNPPMTVQMLSPPASESTEESIEEREYTHPPFKAHELVDCLRQAINQLHRDTKSSRLNCRVRDRIYIAETDASIDRQILRSEPTANETEKIIDAPDGTRHHFLEISAPAQGAELVTIILLRISFKGRTLSLDFAGCALTRTPPEFQRIDRYAEHGKRAILAAGIQAPLRLPAEFTRLWLLAEQPLQLVCSLWARKDRTLIPRRGVMIGTRVSVRKERAQDWGDVQLDKTIVLEDMKIIERRLLNATQDFLKSRKVDTAEFENRAQQLIKADIVNMGGNNEISNSAVGNNAQTNNAPTGNQGSAGNQKTGGNA